jgi:hypothetical protein
MEGSSSRTVLTRTASVLRHDVVRESCPWVHAHRGEHVPRDLRALNDDAQKVQEERELIIGVCNIVREVSHTENNTVFLNAPPGRNTACECDTPHATLAVHVKKASATMQVGARMPEMNSSNGDELVDLELSKGVRVRGEAVLGGREWERVEADGRGRRRDGEGGQEARCRDECDLDLRVECGEQAGQPLLL